MTKTRGVGAYELERMLLIRELETLLLSLFSEGKITGTTHTCLGQEAIPVGIIPCLDRSKDTIFSNHRGHGHFITATDDVEGFLSEVTGKEGAICGGIGGSQHLHSENYFSNGIQGGVPGVGSGVGLAHKLIDNGSVSAVFLGDGTFGEGLTYEALNMASLWSLPILYVVEDNDISQSTPSSANRAGTLLARFHSFAIEAVEIDGQDIDIVRENASMALSFIRQKNGPFGLICKTSRFASHSKGDDIRPLEYIEKLKMRDPIDIIIEKHVELAPLKGDLNQSVQKRLAAILADIEGRDLIAITNSHEKIALTKLQSRNDNLGANNLLSEAESIVDFEGTVAHRLTQTINKLMADNESTIVIGEDIADPYGGAFKITKGIESTYPRRTFTTPVSEAGIVAIANGLALKGFRPIVEIMFGDFLFLAADQIVNHAVKFQKMYGKEFIFSCVIRTPMGGRRGYGPTHSQSLEKHFIGIDGLSVVANNNVVDPGYLLEWASSKAEHTVLFVENKSLYAKNQVELPREWEKHVYCDANGTRVVHVQIRDTESDFAMVAYGGMVPDVLDSAQQLLKEELYSEIFIPETLSPIGERLIELIVNCGKPLLIVEESEVAFGWGAELLALLKEYQYPFRTLRLGSLSGCIPAAPHLETNILPQTTDIKSKVYELLAS